MDFQTLSQSISTIIRSIEGSTVAGVKAIKAHTFAVKVTNPVTKVDVKGTVTVGNQRNLEQKVKLVERATKDLEKAVKEESKLERTVKVTNFPKSLDLSLVEKSSKETNSLLSSVIKSLQSLHFPTKFEVTNQIDLTSELKRVVGAMGDVEKAVKGLKLDPTINVQAPERLVVPPAQVSVEKTEIDYEKMARAIVIPDIDYRKMAELIGKEIASMMVTVGGGRKSAGNDSKLRNGNEFVNNRKVEGLITYYGSQKPNGDWLVRKDDATDINNMLETYASQKNNPTLTTYASAWSARASLTYGIYSDTL